MHAVYFWGPDKTAMKLLNPIIWIGSSFSHLSIFMYVYLCFILSSRAGADKPTPVPARLDVQRTPDLAWFQVADVCWSSYRMVSICLSAPAHGDIPTLSTVVLRS